MNISNWNGALSFTGSGSGAGRVIVMGWGVEGRWMMRFESQAKERKEMNLSCITHPSLSLSSSSHHNPLAPPGAPAVSHQTKRRQDVSLHYVCATCVHSGVHLHRVGAVFLLTPTASHRTAPNRTTAQHSCQEALCIQAPFNPPDK